MARGRREAPRNKQAVRNSYLYSAANQDLKISDNSEGFVVSRKKIKSSLERGNLIFLRKEISNYFLNLEQF